MRNVLERASRIALDLLYPPQCAICRRAGALLCDACADALPPADGRRCQCCWVPITGGPLCGHCIERAPAFESIRTACVMEEGARSLVHRLKYEGMSALAEPMALLMLSQIAPGDVDLIVPVPLHHGRERSRGYNQSALLAKQVAAAAGLPFDARAARRTRATAPLAKTMHRDERRAIVAGAFAGDAARVAKRRVLLVDDVVTTGATLDACADALLAAGAAGVRCVTWARAD
jgi:ComF family protein